MTILTRLEILLVYYSFVGSFFFFVRLQQIKNKLLQSIVLISQVCSGASGTRPLQSVCVWGGGIKSWVSVHDGADG